MSSRLALPSLWLSTHSSARSSSGERPRRRRSEEPAPAELRLAVRAEVDQRAVGLEHVHHIQARAHRLGERLGPNAVERVGRRVVAVELPVRRAHERPDRQVEPGRVVLALVTAPWLPLEHAVRLVRVAQHGRDRRGPRRRPRAGCACR